MGMTPHRRAMIAKLHVAKKQLRMDDAAYREALESATGRRSSADMTEQQLERALAHFAKAGFRTIAAPKERKPYVKLIYRLWGELEAAGALADPSVAACAAFVERQTGVARPEWLGPEEANKAIEGLKAWLMRSRAQSRTRDAR
jgi:phage gp16-like protein